MGLWSSGYDSALTFRKEKRGIDPRFEKVTVYAGLTKVRVGPPFFLIKFKYPNLFSSYMNEQIFDMLLNEEELSWRTILMDLVQTEGMDPWHIDITALTQKYIQVVKEMKDHDLKVSGKIVLAAAILLKVKSIHLIENDISRLDELINETDDEMDDDVFEEVFEDGQRVTRVKEQFTLIPRHPQPRNRKVSIHDLVNALQRAMASKKRVLAKMRPDQFKMPERQIDIMEAIRDVYHKINYYTKKEGAKKISFSK